MDFLRLLLLLALIVFGLILTERVSVSAEQRQEFRFGGKSLSKRDSIFLNHIAVLGSVQPASIVVQEGMIRGTGHDRIFELFDPTAHAETEAIRSACRLLGVTELSNSVMYCSRKPCQMCEQIIKKAGIAKVFIRENSNSEPYMILITQ